MGENLLFQSLLAVPFLGAVIAYLTGRISIRKQKNWGMSAVRVLSVLTLLVDGCILFFVVRQAMTTGGVYLDVGEVSLIFDGVGLILTTVVLFLGLMVTLFSLQYIKGEKGEEKFYALLLCTIGSIIGLGMSFDLFTLWIWFEAMAISTFLLVAFYNEEPPSLEAGIKYLVQSAVGSALVLFGIAIFFSQTGSTSFEYIWQTTSADAPLAVVGGVLLIVGFGVKTALVPLHTWLPDARSQAPSGISAMLSGVVIEAGLIAMLRSLSFMGKIDFNWGAILLGFGCLNILVGNLMALRQTQVKRLLAYSSLAHVGYMLIGFGIGFSYGLVDGASGGFFHLITHSLMKGLAFLAAGALLYALHLSNKEHVPLTLNDLNGASRKYPVVSFALSLAVLALGGLPPLAGFMSKWQILVAGASTRNTLMLIIVIFTALNSVLSLGYYAPMVNRLYRREPSTAVENGKSIPAMMIVPLVIMVIAVIVIGFWPSSMDFFTSKATYSLLSTFFY
jgi:proton-translocating NADH-quinone oxidoreductase chain N